MRTASAAKPRPTVDVDDLTDAIARVVEYNHEEDKHFLGCDATELPDPDDHIAKHLGTLTDWLNDDPKGTHWRKLKKERKEEYL
jgi:hypothetical protein